MTVVEIGIKIPSNDLKIVKLLGILEMSQLRQVLASQTLPSLLTEH